MILLDTNVISETMRPTPSPAVMAWLRQQPVVDLAISSVTVAEIRYGLARLPAGTRRRELEDKFRIFLAQGFADRVLPFTQGAADVYGELVASRERSGMPIDALDAMLAATATISAAQIATRDIGEFTDCGLELINPWKHKP